MFNWSTKADACGSVCFQTLNGMAFSVRYINSAVLVCAAFACFALAVLAAASPYSDAEIIASIVDTWEISALNTIALLLIAVGVVLASAVSLVLFAPGKERKVCGTSLVLAGFAIATALTSHAVLTSRTTALTGQAFGRFYGLL